LLDTYYELSYNTACAMIDAGRLEDAYKRLKEAEGEYHVLSLHGHYYY